MSRRRLWLAAALALAAPDAARAQDNWSHLVARRAYAGEERLAVNVEYGAGKLRIAPASSGELYHAALRYDPDLLRPVASYSEGQLSISLGSGKRRFRRMGDAGRLDLALGTRVPLDLKLQFGATDAEMELGGLRIREARLSIGASSTVLRFSRPNPESCESFEIEVGAASFSAYGLGNSHAKHLRFHGGVGQVLLDFTGEWLGDMEADLDISLGSLTLRLPRDVGVRLRKDAVFADVASDGFSRRNDMYYSSNWASARHRLTLDVDAAFGSVDIQWVD